MRSSEIPGFIPTRTLSLVPMGLPGGEPAVAFQA